MKFKKIYHYVAPCRRCESPATGYYIFGDIDRERELIKAYKNGEYISTKVVNDGLNCFCTSCGVQWHGIIETKFLTKEEIEEQKQIRGISLDIDETIKNYYKDDKARLEAGYKNSFVKTLRKATLYMKKFI